MNSAITIFVANHNASFKTRLVTTQVDRLKAVSKKAHFKAIFDARITFRQSKAIMFYRPLQPSV